MIKNTAIIIGVISSIIFAGYNISKWYHQVLETKILKKKEHIEKLFTFVKEDEDNKTE